MGIEELFEETPQFHEIDELIQKVAANKRELSGSLGLVDVRESDGRSMHGTIHRTPRSRPKDGLQPIVRRPSAASVALHAALAFITKLFGKKSPRW